MEQQLKNNQIPNLPKLRRPRYENIFNTYKVTKDGKDFFFYNINNKVILPPEIDKTFVNTTVIAADLPWTLLAHKLYGNQTLWWTLYILNQNSNKPKFIAEAGSTIVYFNDSVVNTLIGIINE